MRRKLARYPHIRAVARVGDPFVHALPTTRTVYRASVRRMRCGVWSDSLVRTLAAVETRCQWCPTCWPVDGAA